ncbi:MAG: DUF3795 domain-containing protein [Candidatus Korarchaeota archaeon]|nr:DUF3795 domain-containing protein [Candidatus Korarchaeota archaeon]NIU83017.1 DUF3795 domain-containing protein [Candidatus Thorarchaeota archaeon]NIW13451.1 DUF3795 domain-containing protein [Candidatus Thorarchaeota archaeon]NIW51559.1 DUF3795 domain-containing protein [Candidatus Korarchaeota archaeon]
MTIVNKNLVGRCGIYCGSCTIYRAYKDSEKLRRLLAEEHNCIPEDIRCEGCQTVLRGGWEGEEEWGKKCKIIKCLEGSGLEFCYDCKKYPECEKFSELAEFYLKKGENLTKNLEQIKHGKIKEWLVEKENKWRCEACGNPISTLPECHWCGSPILPFSNNCIH